MNSNKKIIIGSVVAGIAIGLAMIYFYKSKGNKKVSSVLFIGDSNTFANFSYADQLKKDFPDLTIKKIAQNGANTSWMKTQLENELKNNKYDVVAILGGSNDVYGGQKLDFSKNNLGQIYKLAHDKGSKVMAVTPPNKNFYVKKDESKEKTLTDLVNWIKNNKDVDYFIDFHNITNNKNYFTSADGYLHPQSSAHKFLKDKTVEKLNLA
ncbi:MAG: SGNH/GDSL hydrolase family protein [Micavibrio sp.]|nr:SGNH/GDSL hydrolase family protein [Micavibrio sp.]